MNRLITICFFLLFASSGLACSCSEAKHFDLLHYDMYHYIFQVTIESEHIAGKDSSNQDTLQPPDLFDFGLEKTFNITIQEVFKGDIKTTTKTIGFPIGSSCSWSPQLGYSYIFYADYFGGIEMCHRKIVLEYEKKEFEQEISILRTLRDKPEKVLIKMGDKTLIEGTNKNGKRFGTWKVHSLAEGNPIAYELTYSDGDLSKIVLGSGFDTDNHFYYLAHRLYSKQIEELNKEK